MHLYRTPEQHRNTANLNVYRKSKERMKRLQGDLAARLHDKWDRNYQPQEIKLAIQHGQSRLEHGDNIDQAAQSAQAFINDSDLLA